MSDYIKMKEHYCPEIINYFYKAVMNFAEGLFNSEVQVIINCDLIDFS